jgi:acyl-CoA hydrolase
MDTDDLSTEAYKGIIIEAEKFNHDLTLQFGVMASSCKNEKEYFLKAKKLIKEIRGLDNDELSDIFFGSLPDRDALLSTLDKILINISEVEKIPETQRHYDY